MHNILTVRISTLTNVSGGRDQLAKIECGSPEVPIGRSATVRFVLGMTDRLGDIADPAHDQLGLDLESENLPKRIYTSRRRRPRTSRLKSS